MTSPVVDHEVQIMSEYYLEHGWSSSAVRLGH